MGDTVQLRYDGGADLTFHDENGRRKVTRGEPFTVDRATAETLMRTDPFVVPADAPLTAISVGSSAGPVPSVQPIVSAQPLSEEDLGALNVDELKERLGAAGLPTGGNKGLLLDRLSAFEAGRRTTGGASLGVVTGSDVPITSSEAEPNAFIPEGGSLPVDGPTVMTEVPPEQAGTGSAPGPGTGSISLGDLPDSAKRKGD